MVKKTQKRKLTSYYRSTKRRNTGGSRRTASKKTYRRKSRNRSRRGSSRVLGGNSRKGGKGKLVLGNLRTYIQSYADRAVCSIPAGIATDPIGKRCTWFTTGDASVNGAAGIGLNGIGPCLYMADILERDEQTTAGSAYPVTETKFTIHRSFHEHSLSNMSNGTAMLTIYYCICQRDVINVQNQQSLVTILGDGFFQRGFGAGKGVTNSGVYDASLTPFDSHKFCSYFKVYKTETCNMDPGQTIKRKLIMGPKRINIDHYTTQTAANQSTLTADLNFSHRKGEKILLFKLEGQPANTAGGKMTFTSPAVDMITLCNYSYQAINRQAPIITKANAIGFDGSGDTGYNVQIMEDETGAVVQQVNA